MSIEKELIDATDLSTKRGEGRQDFLARMMKAVQDLKESEWDELPKDAQTWYNDCAEVVLKNKESPSKSFALPDFPDVPKPAATTSRRASAAKDDERLTKVGDMATVKTQRGREATGKVIELDAKIIVLEIDGAEEEFSMDRVESVTVAHGDAADPAGEPALEVGATVLLVTKRGKEVTGKIVEIDDTILVLDVDGKEEEFSMDRVGSLTISKPAAAASTRRAAPAPVEPGAAAKTPRSSNPAGVSIGARIKELIAENQDMDAAGIGKLLKKDGIEFKEATLALNFSESHKFLDILKARKLLK